MMPWEGTALLHPNLSPLWQILCHQTPVRTCGKGSLAAGWPWLLWEGLTTHPGFEALLSLLSLCLVLLVLFHTALLENRLF